MQRHFPVALGSTAGKLWSVKAMTNLSVIILLPVPKVNKLSVPIFLKKKEILPHMGGNFFFSTEKKCYLMG
jgi:hypothetical protein